MCGNTGWQYGVATWGVSVRRQLGENQNKYMQIGKSRFNALRDSSSATSSSFLLLLRHLLVCLLLFRLLFFRLCLFHHQNLLLFLLLLLLFLLLLLLLRLPGGFPLADGRGEGEKGNEKPITYILCLRGTVNQLCIENR